MRYRCSTRTRGGKNYAARGIRVCERWQIFANFLADMGRKPHPSYSIDRINVNGHYEPGNCRWADQKTQARNTRTNRIIEYQGVRGPIAAVAEHFGLKGSRVNDRLAKGWTIERALSQPVVKKRLYTEAKL